MQIVWIILLGLSLILGWEGSFELRYGEWLVPAISGVIAIVVAATTLILSSRRHQVIAWTKLFAISGLIGIMRPSRISVVKTAASNDSIFEKNRSALARVEKNPNLD